MHQYGIAKPKTRGRIFEVEDIIEKPALTEAPSNLAIAARYVFAPAIFDAIERTEPGKGGEIQLTDAIRLLIADGDKVYGVRLGDDERRYDIGNFKSYFRAFIEFALADEKYGASLREYIATLNEAIATWTSFVNVLRSRRAARQSLRWLSRQDDLDQRAQFLVGGGAV